MSATPSLHPGTPRNLTRRSFIRKAALVAASTAAPAFVPATAFGAKGDALPSGRINVAVIGLGNQGFGHLAGGGWTYVAGGYLAREDVQVRAVCDVRAERRERALRRCEEVYADRFGRASYRDVQACNDFREVLARDDIDAVLLALPFQWHAPMAMMAMRAGKDVYCEKPMAITLQEAAAVTATARRYNRIYQAGTQQRSEYGGKFRLARDLIRNGRLGTLKEVYAYRVPGAYFPRHWTSDASKPVPAGLDWNLWLGPLPWRPFDDNARFNIPAWTVEDINWSPHHYDFVMWALQPDPARPVEIEYADGVVRYHFADGVVLHTGAYPGERTGAQGGACFVGTAGRLAIDRDRIVSYPAALAEAALPASAQRAPAIAGHQDNFLECVRTRRTPISPPEVAAGAITMVLAGGLALALKRSLRFDAANLRFLNDEVANRFCAYTRRAPFQE